MLVIDARIFGPLDVSQTGRRIKMHMFDPTRDANSLLVDRMVPTSVYRLSIQASAIRHWRHRRQNAKEGLGGKRFGVGRFAALDR